MSCERVHIVGVLALTITIVQAGCNQGLPTGTVTGDVTFDGQPVKDGHVLFTPLDGNGQTGGGPIHDGKFQADKVHVGKMKVELHGNKVIGKRKAYDTPESPWEDDVAELLPHKYNFKSDITLDVKRGTQHVKYDFEKVIKRIALLAILGLFPLALFLLWPKVHDRFTTDEVAVAVVRQPREEVLITGSIKSSGAAPFSIQTLLIEEPGKEPYRRLVSLDADNAFELTLGKPGPGTYRASLLLGKPEGGTSMPDRWLATPQITLDADRTSSRVAVKAREYDRPRLLVASGACAAVWVALFVACFRTWKAGVPRTP